VDRKGKDVSDLFSNGIYYDRNRMLRNGEFGHPLQYTYWQVFETRITVSASKPRWLHLHIFEGLLLYPWGFRTSGGAMLSRWGSSFWRFEPTTWRHISENLNLQYPHGVNIIYPLLYLHIYCTSLLNFEVDEA